MNVRPTWATERPSFKNKQYKRLVSTNGQLRSRWVCLLGGGDWKRKENLKSSGERLSQNRVTSSSKNTWEASQEAKYGEGEAQTGFSGHMMFKRYNHISDKEREYKGDQRALKTSLIL